MPALDTARRRLRLGEADLAVAIGLRTDATALPAEATSAVEHLEHAGLVRRRGTARVLAPLLEDLVADLDRARLTLEVETAGAEALSRLGVLIGEQRCWIVTSWPGDAELEYLRIDPRLLGTTLAAQLGILMTSPPADGAGAAALETTFGAFETALTHRGEARAALDGAELPPELVPEHVAARLHETGTDPALAAVLAAQRAAWRITSLSRRDGADLVASLTILDADEQGLWERTAPAEPVTAAPEPDALVRLERRSAGDVLRRLGDLLPGR